MLIAAPGGGQGVFGANGGEGRKQDSAVFLTPKRIARASIRAKSGGRAAPGLSRRNFSIWAKSVAVGLNSSLKVAIAKTKSRRAAKSLRFIKSGLIVLVSSSSRVRGI